jgi:hypothetical protein
MKKIETKNGVLHVCSSTSRGEKFGFKTVDISFQFWLTDGQIKKFIREFEKAPKRGWMPNINTKEMFSKLEAEKTKAPRGHQICGANSIHHIDAFTSEINRRAGEYIVGLYDMQGYDCVYLQNQTPFPGFKKWEINPTAKAVHVERKISDFRRFSARIKKITGLK